MRDTPAQATLANMRKHYRPLPAVQIFAWSPSTDEEYSAHPGDYFMMADDDVLRDSDGEPMILAYRTIEIVAVGS
jgi:hypothetical protein